MAKAFFVPPTVEDVKKYVAVRVAEGKPFTDAETFVAHYESKGWMIGRNKMKCWKAAVTTWEKRATKNNESESLI